MPIKSKVKQYCDHCGDPIPESLIMVNGLYNYNSLSCANCTDTEDLEDEDYDQSYDD